MTATPKGLLILRYHRTTEMLHQSDALDLIEDRNPLKSTGTFVPISSRQRR